MKFLCVHILLDFSRSSYVRIRPLQDKISTKNIDTMIQQPLDDNRSRPLSLFWITNIYFHYLLIPAATMNPGGDDASGLPQIGGTWKGGCFIGRGGSGTIHYWVNVDENDKIRDTMVIKDLWEFASTVEPEAYQGIYKDLVNKGMDFGVSASGKAGEATSDERFFGEAYLQGMMTDPNNRSSATSVPLRGFKRGGKDKVFPQPDGRPPIIKTHWRLYLDLFHAGDL